MNETHFVEGCTEPHDASACLTMNHFRLIGAAAKGCSDCSALHQQVLRRTAYYRNRHRNTTDAID